MGEINCQFYSTKKLENRRFKLSGDPYEYAQGKPDSLVASELRALGIFFWRDEDHPNPVLIPPMPELPLNGYYFQIILDEDTFEVSEYENPHPRLLEKTGDALSWVNYNIPTYVIELVDNDIRVQR